MFSILLIGLHSLVFNSCIAWMEKINKGPQIYKAPPSDSEAGPSKPNAVKNLMCIGVRSKMDAKVPKFDRTLNTHISGVLQAF